LTQLKTQTFAAPLFELVIQIQVPSLVHAWRVRLTAASAPCFAEQAPDLTFLRRIVHLDHHVDSRRPDADGAQWYSMRIGTDPHR
jgi:hypothetical protein